MVRPNTKLRPRIFIASRTAVRTTGSPRRPTARPSAAFQLSERSCAPSSTLPVSSSEKVAALTNDESDRPSFSDQSGPASLSAISSSAVCASGMRSSASARHIIAMPSSRAEVVGVEEGVDARRLVRANALDQRARGRGRFAQRRRRQPRLGEALGDDLLFVGPVGAPQPVRSIGAGARRPALRELPVAMLVLLARAARARRVAADRRFDHVAVASRCGSGGCGMLQRRQVRQDRAASPASMSAVSSSPENGSMCWVMKSGSGGGGAASSWTCARISVRVTSSRIDDQQPLEQQERLLLIFVDRLLLGVAAQVDDLAQRVERREMLLPVMVERLDQDLLLDLDPALRLDALRSWPPSPASASSWTAR